jgi:hypothetical protein
MTKQMGTTGLTFLVGMVLAAPAFAGDSTISLDNRFDGEVEIWLDGKFVRMLDGDSKINMVTRPGSHDLQITRPGTHFVLASQHLHLRNDTTTVVPILPPTGQLRINNTGDVRLKVAVEGTSPVWITPGTSALVPVTTGHVDVVASIHDPRGEWVAQERDVWVEPGQLGVTTMSPDPTVIIIANHDRQPVRALLDGADAGWIPAGTTERMWVRPGPTQVVLLDGHGAVRSQARVVVSKGNEAKIVVQPPVIYPTHTVVVR